MVKKKPQKNNYNTREKTSFPEQFMQADSSGLLF